MAGISKLLQEKIIYSIHSYCVNELRLLHPVTHHLTQSTDSDNCTDLEWMSSNIHSKPYTR